MSKVQLVMMGNRTVDFCANNFEIIAKQNLLLGKTQMKIELFSDNKRRTFFIKITTLGGQRNYSAIV